jgi:iron complex transport system substrate-binding protein
MLFINRKGILIILLAVIFSVAGCGIKDKGNKVSVVDAAGRSVQVPVEVKRIVAIGPGALRFVAYLHVQDLLVGVEKFEKKPSKGRDYVYTLKLASLPVIGSGGAKSINTEPDLEKIMSLKCDLIIAGHLKKDIADRITQKTGIPVLVTKFGPRFGSVGEEFITSVQVLGKVLKKTQRADEIIAWYKKVTKSIMDKVGSERSKKSVYIGGIGYRGLQGIASTDPLYLPITLLKGNNYASSLSKVKHVFVDKEMLLQKQPEIILIDGLGLKLVKGEYKKKPEYINSLQAYKKGKMYLMLPFNFYTTNLGTALIDTWALGKILYPVKFKDVDVAVKGREIYKFLLDDGSVYDKIEKGFAKPGKVLKF